MPLVVWLKEHAGSNDDDSDEVEGAPEKPAKQSLNEAEFVKKLTSTKVVPVFNKAPLLRAIEAMREEA